jgi:hypothetical protein
MFLNVSFHFFFVSNFFCALLVSWVVTGFDDCRLSDSFSNHMLFSLSILNQKTRIPLRSLSSLINSLQIISILRIIPLSEILFHRVSFNLWKSSDLYHSMIWLEIQITFAAGTLEWSMIGVRQMSDSTLMACLWNGTFINHFEQDETTVSSNYSRPKQFFRSLYPVHQAHLYQESLSCPEVSIIPNLSSSRPVFSFGAK